MESSTAFPGQLIVPEEEDSLRDAQGEYLSWPMYARPSQESAANPTSDGVLHSLLIHLPDPTQCDLSDCRIAIPLSGQHRLVKGFPFGFASELSSVFTMNIIISLDHVVGDLR